MDNFLNNVDPLYLVERLVRDREILLTYFADEFIYRYRLKKEYVLQLLDGIGEYSEPKHL
jgi:hypothetical protein